MTLPYPIPSERPYPWDIGFGTGFEAGWPVWALQRAINRFHQSWTDVAEQPELPSLVNEDYVFNSEDEAAVKAVQKLLRLDVDGVAGLATQRRLIKYFTGDVSWLAPSHEIYRARYRELPRNLLHSISLGEAAYLLAITSWNSAENIDIGAFQDNVRDEALSDLTRVQRAFDVRFQAQRKADELTAWYKDNFARPGCSPPNRPASEYPERTWRRAAMDHNRPLDAAVLARFTLDKLDSDESRDFERQWVGVPGYDPDPWNEPLDWVVARGVVVPGTTHRVVTRLDWVKFYALGGWPTWNGLVCRYVTDWS